jgi:hypothetical protein
MEKRTGGETTALENYKLAEVSLSLSPSIFFSFLPFLSHACFQAYYEAVLSSDDTDTESNYNLNITRYRHLLLKKLMQPKKGSSPSSVNVFQMSDPEVRELSESMRTLKTTNARDGRARHLIGCFHFLCGYFFQFLS